MAELVAFLAGIFPESTRTVEFMPAGAVHHCYRDYLAPDDRIGQEAFASGGPMLRLLRDPLAGC